MGRPRKHHRHLPARVTLKNGAYYFLQPVIREDGTRTNRWVRLGRELESAMAQWARIVEPVDKIFTIGDLINRYARDVIPTKAPATQRVNRVALQPLRVAFGAMRPADLEPVHIYRYLETRGAVARVAANREKALLAHILASAIRWGVISTNPCRMVRSPLRERPRSRCPTQAEVESFLHHAPDLLRAYVPLKLLTGLRQQDMLSLRRDQLHEDGIHVRTAKTGRTMVIQWSEALEAAVGAALALSRPVASLFVFCTRRGQQYSGDGFRSIWQRAMAKALESGKLRERFTEHDLRARAATDADELGLDAQALLGHLDAATTRRYLRSRQPIRVQPTR